jgi:hypothetical protein
MTNSASDNTTTVLPDGSAFTIGSFPLAKDHWLYAPHEYKPGSSDPVELPAPLLTHDSREQVIAAIRYAVRGATMCGKEQDFDPDALVQNAVYALCGPYTAIKNTDDKNSQEFDSGLYSTFEVNNIDQGLVFCRELINEIFLDTNKLIIGFISSYACSKDNQFLPVVKNTYDEEAIIKFEPVFFDMALRHLSTGAVHDAFRISLQKQYINDKLTFKITVSVFKLNNNTIPAMLSGSIESNFFVSKLNYKKEIK